MSIRHLSLIDGLLKTNTIPIDQFCVGSQGNNITITDLQTKSTKAKGTLKTLNKLINLWRQLNLCLIVIVYGCRS